MTVPASASTKPQASIASGVAVIGLAASDRDFFFLVNFSKHIDLAAQAEAERSRRAKIIHAEGEKQAVEMLKQAAHTLSGEGQALQLRYLQTLTEISNESSNTIIFPLPMDLIEPIMGAAKRAKRFV